MIIDSEHAETFGTLLGVFLVALLTQYHAYQAKAATETVKNKLDESTDRRDKALATIHALVNSNLAGKLEQIAILAKQLADLTNDPHDVSVAVIAQSDFDNHKVRQLAIEDAIAKATPAPVDPVPLSPIPNKTKEQT